MRRWRKILVVFMLLIVIAAVIYGFMPKPVPVEVVEASRGLLQVTVEEEGKTRVKDRYVISAPVPGISRRIELEVGDLVSKGDVVAQLEPQRSIVLDPRSRAEAEARVAAAKAALRAAMENALAAEARENYAAIRLQRIKGLYESESVSADALDQAETEARQARADLRSAEFAVEVARHEEEAAKTALLYSAAESNKTSQRVDIKAPVDGRVLKIFRESEGVVNSGEPLLEIGDPQSLEVEVDVLSADAVRIAPGKVVFLERWGGEEVLEGRVRVVEPVGFTKVSALGIEEQRVLVIADIVSPSPIWERLGDGYRVEARFIVWDKEGVLQIPNSALFRKGNGWAVFAVEGGRAVMRTVQVGQRSSLMAEVLSGISQDDVVIVHPDDSVGDGTRIRIRKINEH